MSVPLLTLLALLPFVQLGYSYYASVSTLGAILVLLICGHSSLRSLVYDHIIIRSAACLLMVVAAAAYTDVSGQDVLRAAREAVAFFLIAGCATWSLANPNRNILNKVLFGIWLFGLATFAVVIVQTIYLRSHAYFGIPMEYFSQNSNTLPDDLALRYTNLRPSGTFAEPSYLGGVCLSLVFAISPLLKSRRSVQLLTVLLLAIVLVSRSLSGILFVFLYLVFYARRVLRSPISFYLCIVLLVGIAILVASTDNPVSDRLLNGDDFDASIVGRVFGPIEAIPKILSQYPFGIPLAPFQDMGYSFSRDITTVEMTHDGLLNLFINYGLVGFLLVGLIIVSFGRSANTLVYVLAISIQNGGFLTVDKFVIVGFSILLHNSFLSLLRRQSQRAQYPLKTDSPVLVYPSGSMRQPR